VIIADGNLILGRTQAFLHRRKAVYRHLLGLLLAALQENRPQTGVGGRAKAAIVYISGPLLQGDCSPIGRIVDKTGAIPQYPG